MKIRMVKLGTLAAALLSGVLLFDVQAANAQTNAAPDTTATRPAKTPVRPDVDSKQRPASHDDANHRRSQPGPDHQADERRRKVEGR